MFVFVFVGALFRFSVKAPELAPLFQLPPRMKPRFDLIPSALNKVHNLTESRSL